MALNPLPRDRTPTAAPARPKTITERIRGTANATMLLGAIAFLLGFTLGAGRTPPSLMAAIGLVTFAAFIVSTTTIILINRREADDPT